MVVAGSLMAALFNRFPELELLLLSAALLIATHGVRLACAWKLDTARIPKRAQAEAELGPYRVAAEDERSQPLTMGKLPRVDQLWTVAWLRAGKRGVVQALMAHAGAAGWLVRSGAGFRVSEAVHTPSDRVAASFWKELHAEPGQLSAKEVYELATTAAAAHQAELRSQAKVAGLVRSDADEQWLSLIPLLGGLATEVVMLIRVCVMTDLEHSGFAGALFVGVLIVSALSEARVVPSITAKRYLEWLRASAESTISAVNSGERQQPADVTLAVAVVGISAVAMSPAIGDLAVAYELAVTTRQV